MVLRHDYCPFARGRSTRCWIDTGDTPERKHADTPKANQNLVSTWRLHSSGDNRYQRRLLGAERRNMAGCTPCRHAMVSSLQALWLTCDGCDSSHRQMGASTTARDECAIRVPILRRTDNLFEEALPALKADRLRKHQWLKRLRRVGLEESDRSLLARSYRHGSERHGEACQDKGRRTLQSDRRPDVRIADGRS
jgi:hypothetical protein